MSLQSLLKRGGFINYHVTKGFIVPAGYVLTIASKDGTRESLVKHSGEYSGGTYSFVDVKNGAIEGWSITLAEGPYQPQQFINFNSPDELVPIFDSIRSVGGDALYVGGVVRDNYLGKPNKDIDIEVYGVDSPTLVKVLSNYGKVDEVGASFGVIKLTTEDNDYDFSLPRRENKIGAGHKGYQIEVDHTMSTKEAASRRDFTFNSLAATPEGTVLDHFGGLNDLKNKILRHTSDKFAEDPLRVLRGFQFAGRFGLDIDPETANLCKSLKNEYRELSIERVWGEWEKWASKSTVPSAGLEVLRKSGWLELYPELFILQGVKQEEEWHPEGDVWTHTKHVVDAAAEIADRDGITGDEKLVLVLAALCHDLGKPATTEFINGAWRAPGHPSAGVIPTTKFLTSIGAKKEIIEQVVHLVKEHMAHLNEINPSSVRRLALRLGPTTIEMLTKVIEADHSGRPPLPKELPEEAKQMLHMAIQLRVLDSKPTPFIGGKNLIALATDGKIPVTYKYGGPHFRRLIDVMYDAQLEGEVTSPEDAEEYIIDMLSDVPLEEKENYKTLLLLASLTSEDKEAISLYMSQTGLSISDIRAMSETSVNNIIITTKK